MHMGGVAIWEVPDPRGKVCSQHPFFDPGRTTVFSVG
jgi:hypothetical protein